MLAVGKPVSGILNGNSLLNEESHMCYSKLAAAIVNIYQRLSDFIRIKDVFLKLRPHS